MDLWDAGNTADTPAETASLPADWARRPPPGWLLVRGWGRTRWAALPRDVRLRLWRLASLPAAAVGRN